MKKLSISFKTSDEVSRDSNRNDFDRLIDEGRASPSIDGEKAFRQIWSYIARRKRERAAARITAKKTRKKN